MLISIGLYMFNVVCAASGNMQNFPRQLAMQSCVLCLYVRCGSSNQIIIIMVIKKIVPLMRALLRRVPIGNLSSNTVFYINISLSKYFTFYLAIQIVFKQTLMLLYNKYSVYIIINYVWQEEKKLKNYRKVYCTNQYL